MDTIVWMTGIGGVGMLKAATRHPEQPGPGAVRVRHEAIGVNFIDIYIVLDFAP